MDKLIDAGNLVSLVSGTRPEPTRAKGDTRNEGDPFSKVLEQETGKSEKLTETTRDVISSDKKDGPEKKGLDPKAADLEEKLKGKLNLKAMDLHSMANYLYNIALKNPDSLSMSEKQSLKLGEFSPDGVGLKEFQKMLTDRGMKLSDLSFSQIAQLTQRNSRGTINAFLDEVLKHMKEGTGKADGNGQPAPTTSQAYVTDAKKDEKDRKSAELQQTTDTTRLPQQPSVGAPETRPAEQLFTQQTDEQRQEMRERVMEQIIAHVQIQNVGDKTEMTLKLNPEYLGDMRIKLSSQNGELSAQFETTSPEVRELLEEGWEGLKQTFSQKGLNLTKIAAQVVDKLT